MSQNKLISILAVVLLVVIIGSVVVMWRTPRSSDTDLAADTASPAVSLFPIEILQRQAYQLLNKQLVREGALPVQPAASGKANPFL